MRLPIRCGCPLDASATKRLGGLEAVGRETEWLETEWLEANT